MCLCCLCVLQLRVIWGVLAVSSVIGHEDRAPRCSLFCDEDVSCFFLGLLKVGNKLLVRNSRLGFVLNENAASYKALL